MRICIDLDGVICELRGSDQTYDELEPIQGAVKTIKNFKDRGHYIIIYTARRMKTHASNRGKLVADIAKTTLDWLERYGVPYDEIYFGKPWAHIYIDDNAMRFESWDNIESVDDLPKNCEKEKRG